MKKIQNPKTAQEKDANKLMYQYIKEKASINNMTVNNPIKL